MGTMAWHAVVLAASRGPDDPMAKAFCVAHKCALPIAGQPMLRRVVDALQQSRLTRPFALCIENADIATDTLSDEYNAVMVVPPQNSAPASARASIEALGTFPVLITTGDHALLTPEMVTHFTEQAEASRADVLVGLATETVITAGYPQTKRTYFNLGGTRVSGCNLFAVMNENGLRMVEAWSMVERDRKKPWRLVSHFGLAPLFYYVTGRLTPDVAFRLISEKLGITVAPVFMPFAEAAIDVDKPSDYALAEIILMARQSG